MKASREGYLGIPHVVLPVVKWHGADLSLVPFALCRTLSTGQTPSPGQVYCTVLCMASYTQAVDLALRTLNLMLKAAGPEGVAELS